METENNELASMDVRDLYTQAGNCHLVYACLQDEKKGEKIKIAAEITGKIFTFVPEKDAVESSYKIMITGGEILEAAVRAQMEIYENELKLRIAQNKE